MLFEYYLCPYFSKDLFGYCIRVCWLCSLISLVSSRFWTCLHLFLFSYLLVFVLCLFLDLIKRSLNKPRTCLSSSLSLVKKMKWFEQVRMWYINLRDNLNEGALKTYIPWIVMDTLAYLQLSNYKHLSKFLYLQCKQIVILFWDCYLHGKYPVRLVFFDVSADENLRKSKEKEVYAYVVMIDWLKLRASLDCRKTRAVFYKIRALLDCRKFCSCRENAEIFVNVTWRPTSSTWQKFRSTSSKVLTYVYLEIRDFQLTKTIANSKYVRKKGFLGWYPFHAG